MQKDYLKTNHETMNQQMSTKTNSLSKNKSKEYVISSRIDIDTYLSVIGLMNASGYKDISSFVQKAVLIQCKKLASELYKSVNQKLSN